MVQKPTRVVKREASKRREQANVLEEKPRQPSWCQKFQKPWDKCLGRETKEKVSFLTFFSWITSLSSPLTGPHLKPEHMRTWRRTERGEGMGDFQPVTLGWQLVGWSWCLFPATLCLKYDNSPRRTVPENAASPETLLGVPSTSTIREWESRKEGAGIFGTHRDTQASQTSPCQLDWMTFEFPNFNTPYTPPPNDKNN